MESTDDVVFQAETVDRPHLQAASWGDGPLEAAKYGRMASEAPIAMEDPRFLV